MKFQDFQSRTYTNTGKTYPPKVICEEEKQVNISTEKFKTEVERTTRLSVFQNENRLRP